MTLVSWVQFPLGTFLKITFNIENDLAVRLFVYSEEAKSGYDMAYA